MFPSHDQAPGGKVDTAFKTDYAGYGLQGLYALGFLAPRRTILAEQQRLRNLLRQNSEGRQMVSDIDEILTNDALAPVSKDTTQEKIETAQAKKAKKLNTLSDYKQRQREVANNINRLNTEVRSGKITKDYYKTEIKKAKQEYEELKKQIATAEAAGR